MDPSSVTLKVVPLVGKALQQYRRRDVVRNLDREIRAELARDPTMGRGLRDNLETQWSYVHADGTAAALISGLLRSGDIRWLEALEVRVGQLLRGLETIPIGPEAASHRLVQAVVNNLATAQMNGQDATQLSTSLLMSRLERPAEQQPKVAEERTTDRVVTRVPDMAGEARLVASMPTSLFGLPADIADFTGRNESPDDRTSVHRYRFGIASPPTAPPFRQTRKP